MLARSCSVLCVLATLVFAQDDLLTPCRLDDMECIRSTTEQFLEKTSKGIPDMGLKAIDPLEINDLSYDLPQFKITHRFRNLKLTGLKQLQVSSFKMDVENKQVELRFNVSVSGESDISVDYHLEPATRAVDGHLTCEFKFLATTRYPYSVATDDRGVTHYVAGQETTQFQLQGVPKYEMNKKFLDAVNADKQVSAARGKLLENHRADYIQATMAELVQQIVRTLVHNIRQAAAVLPMSAFFKTD